MEVNHSITGSEITDLLLDKWDVEFATLKEVRNCFVIHAVIGYHLAYDFSVQVGCPDLIGVRTTYLIVTHSLVNLCALHKEIVFELVLERWCLI